MNVRAESKRKLVSEPDKGKNFLEAGMDSNE
jgi:hypothetical protein